ncbi:MAG: hypothetical protein ACLP62_05750 [Acidimicrobiales bacterium]
MTATSHEFDATTLVHDAPEVVAGRQLTGIWLFIAGDAVIVGAIVFTYLYLRGLNTSQQWMPRGVHGASDVLAWCTVLVVAASALFAWAAEQAIRRKSSAPVALAVVGSVLALGAVALVVVALRAIPQAMDPTTGALHINGSYGSALLAIDVNNLVHLLLVALLGIGVAVRTARGRISSRAPTQARFVRIYWVWVVVSITASAVVTSVFVSSPK